MSENVLMILNNHYTHDPRVTAEAESLTKGGYNVKVIAWDRKGQYPPHEIINGVEIIRIKIPKIFEMLIPFEILKVPIWQILAYRMALQLYKNWKFRIVHVHDWPDLPIGVWLKKKLGVRVIYDSHEIWSYMFLRGLIPKFLREPVWREQYFVSRHVDVIITVSKGAAEYFLRFYPKVRLVRNMKQRRESKWERPDISTLRVVYIGGFDKNRCILELVKAISKIGHKIEGIFAGPEVKGISDVIVMHSNNFPVKYLGFIPREQVLNVTKKGSLVYLVFNSKDPLYRIGLANKLFEAIVVGRACLAGKGTASGKFVKDYKIGLVVNCEVEEIKKALITLIENPKLIIKFGKRAYSIGSKYNWERESKKLLKIYDILLEGDSNADRG
ncbi:glycosyltransferase [Pyrococcus abyssi]|uniref:Glycosyltransferase, family 1 n=1 Tax=Pyrococcus abyssi (strain GE5 / Orsay) TaxID=272844 RepID=Q9UZJ1_PYRAB|nr:glycosyltransferase [Pyrococcus abyssi]CAB50066.1 Putative glycosyltransferase, family 1 [Pyrococcus abyssi GE5]CCE70572.1 TPA: hypothetical protein PAB1606 [Pyrococcus abyssi GE5]